LKISVLDTSAIIHLSNITVGGACLLERLSTFFEKTYASQVILQELLRKVEQCPTDEMVTDAYEAFVREYKRDTIQVIEPPEACKTAIDHSEKAVVEQFMNYFKEKRLKRKLDWGEKDAAALALHLNRSTCTPACLITGDFKATFILEHIFREQQIGLVYATPDLLIFLYGKCFLRKEEVNSCIILLLNEVIPEYSYYKELEEPLIHRRTQYLDQLERILK